jgi:hypothetical protein
MPDNNETTDNTNAGAEPTPEFDPTWDQATCNANGYFYCTIQQACLNKPLEGGSCADGDGGGTTSDSTAGACTPYIFTYEELAGKSTRDRLLYMQDKYRQLITICGKSTAQTDEDVKQDTIEMYRQNLNNIREALIDIDEGVPTSKAELFTSFYGLRRDKLDERTRRTRPWGTVITEIDTYLDKIPVVETPGKKVYEVATPDTIPEPDFSDIKYRPSKTTPDNDSLGIARDYIDFEVSRDKYSTKHESCLTDLPCTYDRYKDPAIKLPEAEDPDKKFDVDIPDAAITSGCANGDGLFDKLMAAIDSSITLQFKSNRLDNKTFGQFYAQAISAAMQQTTSFLVQKEQLKLDAEKLAIEYRKFYSDKEYRKYETALLKAQITKAILETEMFKDKAPIELAKLTQEAKGSERQVELLTKQTEYEEARIVATYNEIGETNATGLYLREQAKVNIDKTKKDIEEITANGVINRNLTEAKVEQAKAGIKAAKFDALLKKYQAYNTKVSTNEMKATNAANRRLTAADVQTKNKQASLYDQQRKTYIQKQRADVLNIMKDMWNVQIDTLGPEGMAVEAIKGPEFSSRLERAALDVGV